MQASDSLRQEIKVIRDLQHENLIKFLGACLQFPNVSVLTELASKVFNWSIIFTHLFSSLNSTVALLVLFVISAIFSQLIITACKTHRRKWTLISSRQLQ